MSVPSSPSSRQQVNRRGKFRYSIAAPMHYRVLPMHQRAPWKKGTAIDMSATGMLLELQSEVGPETELELVLDWTGLYHGKQKMKLYLTVEVVRNEERGTAVRIVDHRFQEVAQKLAVA